MPDTSLRRELGRWDLTALGVNQVIGGAVFLLPATLAARIGSWSWIAVGLVGVMALLVALNFAEAGSRFEGTGGAYLYTRAAFGRFVGFEVGWMLWFTRAASWSSVVNGLASALGYFWPVLVAGWARTVFITATVVVITLLNLRGIKQSAWVVNLLTIGKLLPLMIFVVLGLAHVNASALHLAGSPSWAEIFPAALLLIFAYGGYEVVPVPAGESRDPTRAVPFAMIMTIAIVATVMTLAQIVALGTLPSLATSKTPLAEASAIFLGAWGAWMMTVGGAVSMTGNNVGGALSGSRNLFALGDQGDIPRVFARLHPQYRTPVVSIVFTSAVALALALTGSFVTLAESSAISRLVIYASTCASVLVLRRRGRAPFTMPLGPVIPLLAIAISLTILFGATARQRLIGLEALGAGAVLYGVARATQRRAA